jgi:hypothetical protein
MNIEHPKEEECYRIGSLHEVKVQWDVADVIKIIIVLRMSSFLLGLIGQGLGTYVFWLRSNQPSQEGSLILSTERVPSVQFLFQI